MEKAGILNGYTDYHCHLLPGVDDGMREMKETLATLHLYESLGIREVWFTPHVMEDIPNTPQALKARFDEVLDHYHGPIKLRLAAENMLDNLFERRLEENDLLTIGDSGEHLLVETSYFNPPIGFYKTLEKIMNRGYTPILAHPERYVYMDEDDYAQLKDMNVMFQLNMYSLLGGYGPEARQKAEWLLTKGHYNLTGTDTHRHRQAVSGLTEGKASKGMAKRLTELVKGQHI